MFYFEAMAFHVADLVEHAVDLVPDRLAVVCADRRATYAEFDARVNKLAHHLARHGIGPGDHVGVYASNSMETLEAMLALSKVRAVAVNVNYRYTENELRYMLSDADAVALIHQRADSAKVAAVLPDMPLLRHVVVAEDGSDATDGVAEGYGAVRYEDALAAESPERDFGPRDPDDPYLVYTGGTTGRPKGVMWTHENIWRALGGGVDFMSGVPITDEFEQARTGAASPLVRLIVAPLIHGQAQWATFGGLFSASTIILLPRFDAHGIWRAVEQERVGVMAIVGDAMARPMIEAYREGPPGEDRLYDTSSLVAVSSTAALMSISVKREYLETFPNLFLTDAIGSSETGFSGLGVVTKEGLVTSRGPRVNAHKDAIVIDDKGEKLAPGSGVVGRLARGGNLPSGYYKDPVKTAALFIELEGKRYAVPGDYALHEEDGTITLLGRGNTCVNTGGEKVFPEEVEGALKSHPGVFDALVIGVPDERLGYRVAAVVQWREGHEPDVADLDKWGRTTLAGYKMPRTYWFADSIERLATGKPDYGWANKHAESNPASVQLPSGTVSAAGDRSGE
jgi:acyl-CoA synthetase (AMP-forming)/AMP-acid ligase II